MTGTFAGKKHSEEVKKQMSESHKRYNNNLTEGEREERRKKRSESMLKKYQEDPEYYKKISNSNKTRSEDPEERRLRSERMKAVWKREDIRTKIITNMKESQKSTKRKWKHPSPLKGRVRPDDVKKKISEGNKGKKHSEEAKQNIGKALKAFWEGLSPEEREKHIDRLRENRPKGWSQKEWAEFNKYRYNNDPEYRRSVRAKYKEYTKTPKFKASHQKASHRRRARKMGLECSLTHEQWNKIIELQGNKCILCGKKFTKKNPATKDHIIPVLRAGPHTMDNTQALCKSCNSRKQCQIDKSNIISWVSRPDLCVSVMPEVPSH